MEEKVFNKYFYYVKKYLERNGGDRSPNPFHKFRSRADHIRRVYVWTKRLLENDTNFSEEECNTVLIAAIFHDIGYSSRESKKAHAERSAIIFKEYATHYGLDNKLVDRVYYLIRNHSNKELLKKEDTPLDLVILLEADLLDEEGAMGIAFDCMTAGAAKVNSFKEVLKYIEEYSSDILEEDPMVTPYAKEVWNEKKIFVNDFIKRYKFDLGIE